MIYNKENKLFESIRYVVDNSENIKINRENIENLLSHFKKEEKVSWLTDEYLDITNSTIEDRIRFLLLYESLNFCYIGEHKWKVSFRGNDYSGSYGLVYTLKRAIEEGYNILNFNYLRNISKEDFENIFRGTTTIPLLNERYEIAKSVAATVMDNLNGDVYGLFRQAKSDIELIDLIVNNFENFRDISLYKGKFIYFYKRAILLTEDLYRSIDEIKNNIKDDSNLLACADYKIPQVLRQAGILEYSKELEEIIDNKNELLHDSTMEIEIRANTIYAIELIKEELSKNGIVITSIEIDSVLWKLSKNKDQKNKPYHYTKTIYY